MLPGRLNPLWILTILLVAGPPAAAQTPLTFEQAVTQALERNPAIRAARARAARAGAEVGVARSAWFPRVTFSEAAHRSNEPVFVFSSLLSSRRFGAANFAVDALNHPGALGFHQASVALEQVVFDGGRIASTARTSRVQLEMADLSVRQAAADLVVSLAEQYGRVLAEDARRAAFDAAATAAAEDLARAERQRDAGRVTDADVLAMSVHLADARQRALVAAGEAASARAQVNRLTGAAVTADFLAVEPVSQPVDARDVAELFSAAEAARPEVVKAIAGERLAREAASAARADWWPRVAARAALESSGLAFRDRSSGWAAGLELQWSLSLGGAELARSRAAAADVSEASAALADTRASVQAELVAVRERQRSARARLDVGRAAVSEARESERIIRDRYDAGLASTNDVLRAATLVLESETARIEAVVDALMADVRFDRAIGRNPFPNP